jgi:hypothetical protein
MPRKPRNPGTELIKLRWSKPDADRNQPREAGKLGGRPLLEPRCPCRKYPLHTAEKRKHHCTEGDNA